MIEAIRNFVRTRAWESLGALAFAGFVGWPLLDPRRLVAGFDTITYSVPNQAVTVEALRSLRLPEWNQWIFGGAPHLASPPTGVFYPGKLPALFFSPHRGVVLLTALHLMILALGMVVLAGGALSLRPPAALVASVVMTGSGLLVTKSLQFEQILTIAWAPWVLASVEATVTSRVRPRRGAAAIALTTGMMLLAGHQQPAYYVVCLATVWGLLRALGLRRPGAIVPLVGGLALGGALAGVQVLVSWAMVGDSIRSEGAGIASASDPLYRVPLRRIPSMLLGELPKPRFPERFAEMKSYVGASALSLALIGIPSSLRGKGRTLGGILVLAAVGSLLLAVGSATPAYELAFRIIPGFNLFRVPARWVLVLDISLALLAAVAIDSISRTKVNLFDVLMVMAVGAFVGVLVALGMAHSPGARALLLWGALTEVTLLAAALTRYGSLRRWAIAALVVIPLLELGIMSANSDLRKLALPLPLAMYPFPGEPIRFLSAQTGRALILGPDDFQRPERMAPAPRPNLNTTFGVRSIDGYDGGPQVTRRWIDAMSELTTATFNPDLTLRAQLRSPLDPDALARFGVLWVLIDTRIYSSAAWVPSWRGPVVTEKNLELWENPAFVAEAMLAPSGVPLRIQRPRPEEILIEADSDRSGRIVVAEQWSRGWKATIDGRAVKVIRADDFFLGVPVGAGHHKVRFEYRTPMLTSGALISGAALVAILLLAAPRSLRPGLRPRMRGSGQLRGS